eukprot:CAMPEP_0183353440 /NCGR_PEP_ID=MMETSP0164_2-20130417/33251_1 /TAXON_ID=221442 /ORGANISM="Coccolithus pelagicus ssp braarudi, Strain PLY182g" /LENGTH=612 /DNA_ID=CAMNT_0025526109 /DNA_START=36 /DNA_END=1874 /DNA_ORIENTATION=+
MARSLLYVLISLACARAAVEEVTTQAQFKKILSENPAVVVDFYSQTCGPCIMMAPVYKEIAREYEGRVAFIKVDVQRSYVGVNVRSMPTFHFYLQGTLDNQFSGADERSLRSMASSLATKADQMNIELSLGALEAFYQKHDTSKLDNVDEIYEKYPAYKLVNILKKKYGAVPEYTQKKTAAPASSKKDKKEDEKVIDVRKMDLEDLKAEIYRRELTAEEKEYELFMKKNARRKEKLTSAATPVKVAILGGGPAGVTAAIYAARAGLKPLVIAPPIGGQLMSKGVNVENYPGIPEATGGEIIRLMKRQAIKYATTFEEELVLSVDLSQRPFVITTNTSAFTAHSIVLATGADARWLDVPGEEDLKGGGVSSCATCDGFLYSGKPVIVVGGGDTAMEEALVLARTSSSVVLVHRRDEFRASQIMQEAVLSHPKISIMWNTTVKEFSAGEGGMLSSVIMQDVNDAENITEVSADGAFVAIGHIPNTGVLQGQVAMNDQGYLVTNPSTTSTSVEGVFAAGDVADWMYRQAVTSAGSGSQAALDAERWLSEKMLAVGGEAAEEEDSEECHPEDYESWTMKQIKKAFKDMGVDASAECRGCMEKYQFIELLCRHGGAR